MRLNDIEFADQLESWSRLNKKMAHAKPLSKMNTYCPWGAQGPSGYYHASSSSIEEGLTCVLSWSLRDREAVRILLRFQQNLVKFGKVQLIRNGWDLSSGVGYYLNNEHARPEEDWVVYHGPLRPIRCRAWLICRLFHRHDFRHIRPDNPACILPGFVLRAGHAARAHEAG